MSESLGDLRGTISFDVDTKTLQTLIKSLQGVQGVSDDVTGSMDRQGKASSSLMAAKQGLTKGATALAAGIAAAGAAIGVATQAATEYDAAMTEVATLTPDVANNMAQFKQEVLGVSAALGQDAVTATNGLYNAISAGIPADNAVSFLETAGKAAVAGVSDINTAVSALSVGLNAYNLDAAESGRVSDALFTGVKLGVTTFGELGSSLGKVAGIASSSGASIEQTVATLAQITTKGFGTAEAVTALKATFVSLSKPSKEVQEALEAQGFASAKAAIEANGLQYVMELVRDVADETGKPLISLVGSAEAVNAVLATTGDNAAAAREKVDAFGQATGATAAAFDLISATPAQQIAVFREQVNAAKIAVGDAFLPALGSLLEAVTPLVEKLGAFARETLAPMAQRFSEMPEPVRGLVAVLGGLSVVGGTVAAGLAAIMGVVGPLAGGLGLLGGATGAGGAAAGVGALSGVTGALGSALGVLTGPLGWAVGLTAALGIAAFKANAAQQEQFATVQEAGGAFGSYLEAARGAREEAGLFGRIGFMASDAWASFKDVLTNFLGVLSPLVDTLKGAGQAVGGVLSSLGEKVGLDLSFPEPSEVGAIRDATMAYLEMNKGFDESVLKSGEFKTAQAQAALALENGEIGAVEYKNALESAAGAIARHTAEAQLDAEAAATQSSAYADLTDGATAYSSVMVDANGQIITAAQQRAAAEADAAQAAIDAQAADLQRLVNRGEMEQVTADSIIASRQRAVDNMVEGLAVTQSGYDAERTAMLAMADGGAEALGFLGSSHQTATNIITTGQREMQGEFANTGSAASTSFGSIDETVTDTAAGMVAGAADIEGATTTVRDAFGNIAPGAQQLSAGVGGALDAVIPKVAGFADETERAAQAQARAQGEAVGAAEDFGAGTVDSFAGVSDQAVDTTGMVGELQVALEELPPEVTTAYVLTGVPQARELLAGINADLQSIAAVIKFSLVGTYTGTGGAEKNSPMAVLTDIWSLRDESSMPFGFAATYSASGAMAWEAGQLAITGGVAALRRQAEDPIEFTVEARISEALQLLLFDADYEAAALQAAQDELARLGEEADKAAAKLALAQQALDGFTPRVVKEINEFFGGAFQSALGGASGALGAAIDAALASASLSDQDPALRELLNSFRDMFQLDASFFGDYGILDPETLLPFSSLDEARARLAELFAGTPEQREQARDLWETLSSGLETAFKSASQQGIDALWAYREALGPEGEKIEGEFLRIEAAIKGAQDQLADALKDETGEVETQLEIYDRLTKLVDERAKLEADAQRAIEQANRDLERQIKDRQKAAEEAENDAHRQTMDAIEAEMGAREDAYEAEMDALDRREEALERDIEILTAREEKAHQDRLARITAETDAEQARIDAQTKALDRAEALLKVIEDGVSISQEEHDLLVSLGIDPARLLETNASLEQTRRLVDDLNNLIADLPSESRARAVLADRQRAILQRAIDQGLVGDADRRIVEIALAGREVPAERLREILAGIVDELGDEVETGESYLDVAEQKIKNAKELLDLDQQRNDENRAALDDEIAREDQRHQDWLDRQEDRREALDSERETAKENHDAWMRAAKDAQDAEKDRHDARLKAIDEEYAYQLLALGKTDAEINAALAERDRRAAAIADERERRLRRWAQDADREAGRIVAEGSSDGAFRRGGSIGDPATLEGWLLSIGEYSVAINETARAWDLSGDAAWTAGQKTAMGIREATAATEDQTRAQQRANRAMRDAPLYHEIQTSADFARYMAAKRAAQSMVTAPEFDSAPLAPTTRVNEPPLGLMSGGAVRGGGLGAPSPFQPIGGGIRIPEPPPIVSTLGDATEGMALLTMATMQLNSALMSLPVTSPEIAAAIARGGTVNVDQREDRRRHFEVHGDVLVTPGSQSEEGILDALGVTY